MSAVFLAHLVRGHLVTSLQTNEYATQCISRIANAILLATKVDVHTLVGACVAAEREIAPMISGERKDQELGYIQMAFHSFFLR